MIHIIHDLKNPETGKTYKEENLEKQHNISLGSLVELDNGVRLFVIGRIRDCDGTPLYRLAADKNQQLYADESKGLFHSRTIGNYSEKFLQVVFEDENFTQG